MKRTMTCLSQSGCPNCPRCHRLIGNAFKSLRIVCPFGTWALSQCPRALPWLAMQNQATLAHLGRHVGFDPDHMAAMSGAWLRRKVRHPWLGGPRRLTMYLATLDCATSNPSLSSAPQSGFSTLIRRQLKRRHVLAFFEKRPGCHQLRMSPEGQRSQRVQPTGD